MCVIRCGVGVRVRVIMIGRWAECCFSAGGVLECNLVHRRSVAVLCMLYKIKSNPVNLLSGAFPLPYVPARVTLSGLIAHRHSFAPHR